MSLRVFEINEENEDSFDSYDSTFRELIVHGNNLIVPLVNMAVVEHQLNPDVHLNFIDISFLVYLSVRSLLKNDEDELWNIIDSNSDSDSDIDDLRTFGFAGSDYIEHVHPEFSVICRSGFLLVPREAKISTRMWRLSELSNSEMENTEFVSWTSIERFLPEVLTWIDRKSE